MTDYRADLEHDLDRVGPARFTFDDVTHRRDRKHLNKRIAAGVVGIGVFVAAVWIVTSGLSFDRTETPIAPGPTFTQPGTGGHLEPGESFGPSVTGPVIGPTGDSSSVGFDGLPPEGTPLSEPLRGELVMSDEGIQPWWHIRLYADGRLIWAVAPATDPDTPSAWIEQRLTAEGVELLRSGVVALRVTGPSPARQLPVSAWEDATLRPYVPSRYAVCLPSSQAVDLLPAQAQDLLRGTERVQGCLEVTIDDARAFVEILSDAGVEVGEAADLGMLWFGSDVFGGDGIRVVPVLPDGSIVPFAGG